ncbi:AMP-binding protein [bacterium]|nr:AMP-binding protein [bacterium]
MSRYWDKLRPDKGVFPLSELVQRTADEVGDRPVMRTHNGKDGYDEITYNQLRDRINAIARWLVDQGIRSGDRVAVLGENSPSWAASYLGIQTAGAIVVPVDSLMPPSGMRHILSDSGARMLFMSQRFTTVIEELETVSTLEKYICFAEGQGSDYLYLEDVVNEGMGIEADLPKRSLDELAAFLYTSGTTGHSKGVMLSQRNLASNVAAASRILDIGPEDTFISVLPVHHSFEATAGFLLPLYCGASITYARSLKSAEIVEDIKNTGVTLMVGVPLLYEKMQQGMMRKVRQQGKEKLVNSLMGVVKAGKKVGLNLGAPLFKSLRTKGGLDKVRIFVSGGGPLDPVTAHFFNSLGLRLFQGYGLTETSPVTHVNLPFRIRHETVGPPVPGVECKIINPNDQGVGEVCVKGPNIFQGYFKNEEATKATFTEDGWFKTGDLGFIHKDEYLQITGRAKNMLVTGGGKNVYPEEIEFYLNRTSFIAESLVLGIPREKGLGDEVAALIYPDYEQLDLHFEEQGKTATEKDVFELVKETIREAQKELADYKRIKTFRIVEEEFQKTSKRSIKRFLYNGEMVKVNGEKVG